MPRVRACYTNNMNFFERLNPLGPGKRSEQSPEELPADELTPEERIDLERELTRLENQRYTLEDNGGALSADLKERREFLIERLGLGDRYNTNAEEERLWKALQEEKRNRDIRPKDLGMN